jgi:hypothetical protein
MIDVVLVKLTEVVSHMRIQFEVRGTILQNRRPTILKTTYVNLSTIPPPLSLSPLRHLNLLTLQTSLLKLIILLVFHSINLLCY